MSLIDSKKENGRAYYGVDDDYGLEDDEDYLGRVYDPSCVFIDADDDEIERAADEASRAARRLQFEIAKQDRGAKSTRSGGASTSFNTLRARCCPSRTSIITLSIFAISGLLIVIPISLSIWAAGSTSNIIISPADAVSDEGIETFAPNENAVLVPKAPTELESACSGNFDGTAINLADCQRYCNLGSCCLEPGAGNCFVDNSETCPDYQDCTILKVGKSPGSLGQNLVPAPTHLGQFCSEKSISNADGREMCDFLCTAALCCIGGDGDCSSQQQSCDTYSSCRNVWPSSASDADNASVTMRSPIEILCSSYDPADDNKSGESLLCETSCTAALCCSSGACNDKNALTCMQYKACPASISNQEVPEPQQALANLCSSSNVNTQDGLTECTSECSNGACCFQAGAANCFANNEEMCRRYDPCLSVPDSIVEPELPNAVEVICSPDKLATDFGRALCTNVCSEAGCCVADGPDNCYEFNRDMCDQYRSCSILTIVPEAPDDLFELCCSTDSKPFKCTAACDKASCCFDEGPGSCVAFNEMTCESYNICHDKLGPAATVNESSPVATMCSKSSLNSVSGRVGCRQQCEPAKCCIAKGDSSCVDENKDMCEMFAPFCSKMWSDEEDEEEFPLSTIAKICSVQSIATESGREQCEAECLHAACCDAEGAYNCVKDNQSWCKEFSHACKILDNP